MIGSCTVIQSTLRFISNSKYPVAIYPEIVIEPNIGEKVQITKNLKILQEKYLSLDKNNHNVYTFRYNKNYDKYVYFQSQGYIIVGRSRYICESLYDIYSSYYEGKYSRKNDEIKLYIGKDKNLCFVLSKVDNHGYVVSNVCYNNEDITKHIFKFSSILNNSITARIVLGKDFFESKYIEFKFSDFVENKYSSLKDDTKYLVIYNILNDYDSTLIYITTLYESMSEHADSYVLFYKNRYLIISGRYGIGVIDFMADKVLAIQSEERYMPYKHEDKIYLGNYTIYVDENGGIKIKENKENILFYSYDFLNGKEVLCNYEYTVLIEQLFDLPVFMYLHHYQQPEYYVFSMLLLYIRGSPMYEDILVIKKCGDGKPSEKNIHYYSPIVLTQLYDKE